MKHHDPSADVKGFRSALEQRFGWQFDETRDEFLARVLAKRANAQQQSPSLYVERLNSALGPSELKALVSELTVTETYFFRHVEQYRALVELALPARLRRRRADK